MSEEALVYRHLVVHQKGVSEAVTDRETLKRAEQALEAAHGKVEDVPEEFRHLVKQTITQASVDKAHAGMDGVSPEMKRTFLQSHTQPGVIVARVTRMHVPGGVPGERLPRRGTIWTDFPECTEKTVEAAFLEGVERLQGRFKKESDRKFRLLADRKAYTLVTVVISPIMAHPRESTGFHLQMEFHQITRFGNPDVGDFDVYSETGDFPVQSPGKGELLTMMKSVEDLAAQGARQSQQGLLLSDEARKALDRRYGGPAFEVVGDDQDE